MNSSSVEDSPERNPLIFGIPPAEHDFTSGELDEKLGKKLELFSAKAAQIERNGKGQEKKEKLRERVEKILDKYKSAKNLRTFDKIMFVIGLTRITYEAFLLGRDPC